MNSSNQLFLSSCVLLRGNVQALPVQTGNDVQITEITSNPVLEKSLKEKNLLKCQNADELEDSSVCGISSDESPVSHAED